MLPQPQIKPVRSSRGPTRRIILPA